MTALIAAFAGVLGISVGRYWDTRAESVRWRRDQTTTVYQRFAEQFKAFDEALRVVAFADPSSADYQRLVDQVRTEQFPAWDSALAALWLHGDRDVVLAAVSLDRAIAKLFYDALDRQVGSIEEWRKAGRPARQAFDRFIETARRELRLPAVPVNFYVGAIDPVASEE
ncbi:hypothetical protein [Nocardia sp. NPDC046763]|uniref:hypothetical protein n=1 Tax=Nocardia sp. NPDC046763 TaxID=3155256 RepID=UPI0034118DD4